MLNKTNWLAIAEVVDSFRVVPRLLLLAYGFFVLHVFNDLVNWYQALPAAERSLETTGLVTALVTAITGMGAWFSKLYVDSGRRWNGSTVVSG